MLIIINVWDLHLNCYFNQDFALITLIPIQSCSYSDWSTVCTARCQSLQSGAVFSNSYRKHRKKDSCRLNIFSVYLFFIKYTYFEILPLLLFRMTWRCVPGVLLLAVCVELQAGSSTSSTLTTL